MVTTDCDLRTGNSLWSHNKSSSNVTVLRIIDCAIWPAHFGTLIAGFPKLKELAYSIRAPSIYAEGYGLALIKDASLVFAKNLQRLKIELPAGSHIRDPVYTGSLRDFTKLSHIEINHMAFRPSEETTNPLTDVLPESCEMLKLNNVRPRQGSLSGDSLTDILVEGLLKGALEHQSFPHSKQIITQNQIKPPLRAPWEKAGVSFRVEWASDKYDFGYPTM